MSVTNTNWELLAVTRFILSFIVVAVHLASHDNTQFLNGVSQFGGFEAVLGFLLISGFSIGKSISRNKESYFKRRIARIYPVYIAALVTAILVIRPPFSFTTTAELGLNLLFLTQVFTINSFNLPTWTLALEVWMYAIAPVLLKASYKQLNILIYGSFLCYCIYTCGRTLYHWPYFFGTYYGLNAILLCFAWIAGFAIAVFPERERFNKYTVAFLYAGHLGLTALIAIAYSYKHHELGRFLREDMISFAAKAVCLAWVYLVVLYNYKFKSFNTRVSNLFDLLGNISYPLYLVHLIVFVFFNQYGYHFGPVMVVAAVFYSWLIYIVFDFYSKKRKSPKQSVVTA